MMSIFRDLKKVYLLGFSFFLLYMLILPSQVIRFFTLAFIFSIIMSSHLILSFDDYKFKRRRNLFLALGFLWSVKIIVFFSNEVLNIVFNFHYRPLEIFDAALLVFLFIAIFISFIFDFPFYWEKTNSIICKTIGWIGLAFVFVITMLVSEIFL